MFHSHKRGTLVFAVCISSAVLSADPGAWLDFADAPTSRQEVGVGFVAGKMYVIGGFANGTSVNTVERYDPNSNTWETIDPLPSPQPLNHVGVAAADGKLFVIGGLTQTFAGVNTTFCYDPVEEEWTPKATMPTFRGGMGVAEVDGLIYAAG